MIWNSTTVTPGVDKIKASQYNTLRADVIEAHNEQAEEVRNKQVILINYSVKIEDVNAYTGKFVAAAFYHNYKDWDCEWSDVVRFYAWGKVILTNGSLYSVGFEWDSPSAGGSYLSVSSNAEETYKSYFSVPISDLPCYIYFSLHLNTPSSDVAGLIFHSFQARFDNKG